MAESWNEDKNNNRVSVLSAHVSELSSLWTWENYLNDLAFRVVFPLTQEMNIPSLKSLETQKWGFRLKCLSPKTAFRFNYNDQSVSCACPQPLTPHDQNAILGEGQLWTTYCKSGCLPKCLGATTLKQWIAHPICGVVLSKSILYLF